MNQRRSASSNPSVLWASPAQARQVSGRISIEGPVSTATQRILGWAVDANTVFVLGSDGNLWFETGPWESVSDTIMSRNQIDSRVMAFQVLDVNTLLVLGTNGNLWLEVGPWSDVANTIAARKQIDGSVIQFWGVDSEHVFVCGSDLNLWFETGPWVSVSDTIASRAQWDSNVNDLQPIGENQILA